MAKNLICNRIFVQCISRKIELQTFGDTDLKRGSSLTALIACMILMSWCKSLSCFKSNTQSQLQTCCMKRAVSSGSEYIRLSYIISSVESQKGAIAIQRCPVENQKIDIVRDVRVQICI